MAGTKQDIRYDARVGVELLTERYQSQIAGVLSCYDRIIVQGTLPKWCYAKGMTDYFYEHQIRIFDYPRWAEPLRDAIRENMERIAAENDIEIEFIRSKKKFRQEKRVKEVLEKRGEEPGLVCILSAMEPCGTYKPWHDKKTHKTYLKPDDGKCLHYYVYWIDPDLGLCYVRVPTWCPFRLQVYGNGHSYLARQLSQRQIEYRVLDNAFGWIADFERSAEAGGQLLGGDGPPQAGRVRRAVLPGDPAVQPELPLEPGASRIRHRCGICPAGRLASYL